MFNFFSGLFVLVHVRIRQWEFDGMGCTWNAERVTCMISVRVANRGHKKARETAMKSEIVQNMLSPNMTLDLAHTRLKSS